MNFEFYIAKRISFKSKRRFSKTVVRIAVSAIAISVAVMLISFSILIGFQTNIKNKISSFSGHIQITYANLNYTFENPPITYNQQLLHSIRNMDEVAQVYPFAGKAGIVKTKSDIEGIILKGIDSQYAEAGMAKFITRGSFTKFVPGKISNDIVISESFAHKLGLELDDALEIYFVQNPPRVRKFKVRGIYKTGLEEIDKSFALVDLRHIQKLNNWDSAQVGGYEVVLNSMKNMDEINDIIRVSLPIDVDSKTIRNLYPQIFDWLSLLDRNVQIIIILMLVVGTVNMITALLIMIIEKTKMIGTLKSLGARESSIGKIFIYNAFYLIVAGILFGDILGIGILSLQYYFNFISLPAEYYFIDRVPVVFTWSYFALVNAGTLVFCTLAMYLPARFVSRIDPVKTLRFE